MVPDCPYFRRAGFEVVTHGPTLFRSSGLDELSVPYG